MSTEDLEKFRKEIWKSPQLQERLKDSGDQQSFINLVVREGRERGYSFTPEDLEEFLQSQNQRVSEASFSQRAIEQIIFDRPDWYGPTRSRLDGVLELLNDRLRNR